MSSKFKIALIQLAVSSNKSENIKRAVTKISEAVDKGANIVSLPGTRNRLHIHFCANPVFNAECFNSPYGTQYFKDYAEEIPEGPSCLALQEAAKKNKVSLI